MDTRATLVDANNPPTFQLSGSGNPLLFIVTGPYSSIKDLESGNSGVQSIWEIAPNTPSRLDVDRLPKITYGVVPPGFEQRKPAVGPPEPLIEGKYYGIGMPSMSANSRTFCFKVESAGVETVLCS